MASYWSNERPTITSDATVEQCMRLLGGISPRLRVRCAFGLHRALQDALARHDLTEAVTLRECLRRLRGLLRE